MSIEQCQKLISNHMREINKLRSIIFELSIKNNDTNYNYDGLNEQQLAVVNSKHNIIKVIAGPGSGKTHTTVMRYLHLIDKCDYNPDNIILITFTKKAGKEMEERIKKYTTRLPFYVGSIHGLAYKVLIKNETVIDDTETAEIIRDCVRKYNSDEKLEKMFPNYYDYITSDYPMNFKNLTSQYNIHKNELDIFKIVLKEYENYKKKNKLLDYNDLLVKLCNYLSKNCELKQQIKYIFFDEFQDINPIQYYILSKFNCNKMIVGDDCQSIYSFRGSNVKYINEFVADKTYLLEYNYRSTGSIVNLCEDSIKKNTNRFNKNIKTTNDLGIKPTICHYYNYTEEYKDICNKILKMVNDGIEYKNISILSRYNKSLKNIEIVLNKKNIPSMHHRDLSLLNRPIVKHFIAIVKVVINNHNEISWKRILKILNCDTDDIYNYHDLMVERYNNLYLRIVSISNIISVNEQLRNIYKILKELVKDEDLSDISKIISIMNDYTNLQDIVSDLTLKIDIDDDIDNRIYLSTIHGAKGLEWDYVFIIDSEEFGCRDYYDFKEYLNLLEEERRLFYVALSRAKKNIDISYTGKLPGQFLLELKSDLYCGELYYNDDFRIINDIIKCHGIVKNAVSLLNSIEINSVKINNTDYITNNNYNNNFYKLLIYSMIYNKYPKAGMLTLDNLLKYTGPEEHKSIFDDKYMDWKDKVNAIYNIATYKKKINIDDNLLYLTDIYAEIYKKLPKLVKSKKIKYGHFLISDDFIFIIKTTETYTINIYDIINYIIECKKHNINNIMVYNVMKGELYKLNINNEIIKVICKIYDQL